MLSPILLALAASAVAGPVEKPAKRAITSPQAYASNEGLSLRLSSITPPTLGGGGAGSESTWSLSIDDTSSGYKQTITGFGGAVTDSTVTTFNSLSNDQLTNLLNTLMTEEGANFSLLRHTIGASDLSGQPAYTYCDTGSASNPNLNGFNLGDRGTAMARMLARMKSLNGKVTILGTPWSPPGWMKLNGQLAPTSTNCNNLNDGYLTSCPATGPDVRPSYAQYFVEYIRAYEALGAHIDAITIQNEPLNSNTGFPTMYMYSYESASLIQNYVGPALSQAGLNTKIWGLDHNTEDKSFAQTVLDNAGQYVNTIAWHCYNGPDWTVLSSMKSQYPQISQYMTECYTPAYGADGAWNAAPNFVMGPLQNWASGAMSWNIGANSADGPNLGTGASCTVCQGLVTISGNSYTFNPAFYGIAQFSKFIPVGARIVSGTGSYSYSDGTGIQSVASVNPDGSRTVVMINNFPNDVYITVKTQSGQTWGGNVPQHSTTTWLLPPA